MSKKLKKTPAKNPEHKDPEHKDLSTPDSALALGTDVSPQEPSADSGNKEQEPSAPEEKKASASPKKPPSKKEPSAPEEKKISAPEEKKTSAPKKVAAKKPCEAKAHTLPILVALGLGLFACLGVLAVAYMSPDVRYFLAHQEPSGVESKLQQELQQLNTLTQDQAQQLAAIPVREARLSQQQQGLSVAQQQLSTDARRLQRQIEDLQSTSRADWQLAEVEYLLRLANQRLLIEADVKGVAPLLSAADGLLDGLDNLALFEVRKALAEDVAALRATPQTDVEGIYLQLHALSEQVMNLPVQTVEAYQADAQVKLEVPADASLLQRLQLRVEAALLNFKSYFRINTHRGEGVEELLRPDQELYLRQNLRMMLEQSQLALLRKQPVVYQQSLARAQTWLQRYYSHSPQHSEAIVTQLQELAAQPLAHEMPDISRSLQAIRAFNQQLHKAEVEGSTAQGASL